MPPNPAFMETQNFNPFVATPKSVVGPNWYVDSGASNHVTPDTSNMTNPFEYGGKECVTVGNGNSLSISHVGSCLLSSDVGLLKLKKCIVCAYNCKKSDKCV